MVQKYVIVSSLPELLALPLCNMNTIIIRWFSLLKGVFINPALVEPFGLTLIEVTSNYVSVLVYLLYTTRSSCHTISCVYDRQLLMVCPLLPPEMEGLLIS